MFTSIKGFTAYWKVLSDGTSKIFAALTDESLGQSVAEGHRDIGRIAWHIVTTIPEMGSQTGLKIAGPAANAPLPATVAEISANYKIVANSLAEQIEKNWDDAVLQTEDNLYGESWKRGLTLKILADHEIHHRGQLTVLMRQAGLKVPGIFGPAKEEWVNYNAQPPEI